MPQVLSVLLLTAMIVSAAEPAREMVYPQALSGGERIVPRYDKGYVIFVDHPNHFEVHAPDGTRLLDVDAACPGSGSCSIGDVAANSRGELAVSLGYATPEGYRGGIRIIDRKGVQVRFIETALYVPRRLAYDKNDALWVIGWQRDAVTNDMEDTADYALVRKYSAEGRELGRYIQRSLWIEEHGPSLGGGYWLMEAASDRIGAMVRTKSSIKVTEWIEWDLDGRLLSRTAVPLGLAQGRAYSSDGRLYACFPAAGQPLKYQLRVLDKATGQWAPVSAHLPDSGDAAGAFLQGSQGTELVYRLRGPGVLRLLLSTPDTPLTP